MRRCFVGGFRHFWLYLTRAFQMFFFFFFFFFFLLLFLSF
jgi:hypothetical protein